VARPAAQPADPRYRPFRIGAYAIYLAVVGWFSVVLTVSVVRSVLAMTPRRDPVQTATLDLSTCVGRASALFEEMEERRRAITAAPAVSRAAVSWTAWRVEWLNRLRQAESSCGVGAADRAELGRLFGQLEHLEDLYTTSAVQTSGEIGPALDRFRRALEAARQPR
jgi:hypothetical protein